MPSNTFHCETVDAHLVRTGFRSAGQSDSVSLCLATKELLRVGLGFLGRPGGGLRHGRLRSISLVLSRLDAHWDGAVLLAARQTLGVELCACFGFPLGLLLMSKFAERCTDVAAPVLADPAARVCDLLQFVLRGQRFRGSAARWTVLVLVLSLVLVLVFWWSATRVLVHRANKYRREIRKYVAGVADDVFEQRLREHLGAWVGEWPPPGPGVHVVGHEARRAPTWDGSVKLLQGVGNGVGTVIGVPPDAVDTVTEALSAGIDREGLGDEIGAVMGVGPASFGAGVFRTTTQVNPDIDDVGDWFEQQEDGLPEWLAPFNGPRLVAFDDDGTPIAGVGIKVHDRIGQELAVVTDEAAQGRGLARRLVATAARRVLAEGGVPTYLHAASNVASARVAEAVGFADEGWTIHGLWPRS